MSYAYFGYVVIKIGFELINNVIGIKWLITFTKLHIEKIWV
jgi:hypothetical protein